MWFLESFLIMIIFPIHTKNKKINKKGSHVAPDWSGSLFIKKDVLVILLFFPQNDGCLDDHAWRLSHLWYHFPSLGSGLTLMRSAASPRSGVWGQSPASGVPFFALTLTVRKRLTQMTRNYLNSASGLICLLKQTYLVGVYLNSWLLSL